MKNPKKYNCVVGVSLGTMVYSKKENVKKYLTFATKNFNNIMIFINDYNYHYDLMAFQNLNKNQAIEKAKRMGKELKNNYQNTLEKFFPKDANKVKIITFFELLENKKFQEFQKNFHKILQENKKIEKEIWEDLYNQIFHTKSIAEKLWSIKKDNLSFYLSTIRFCKNYILDQLVASIYLMFKLPITYNIRVSLTPYSQFVTLKKLLSGDYNNLKEKLNIPCEFGYVGGIIS